MGTPQCRWPGGWFESGTRLFTRSNDRGGTTVADAIALDRPTRVEATGTTPSGRWNDKSSSVGLRDSLRSRMRAAEESSSLQRTTQDSTSQGDEAVDLREYAAVLRRRAVLLIAMVVGFTVLAGVYSFTRTPVYTAESEVLLQPASTSSQYRPDQLVSVDTEARLVTSAQVAALAKETLGWDATISGLLQKVSVKTTPETLVLDIAFTDADPDKAAAGADAFATGYLDYKRQHAEETDAAARKEISDQLDDPETGLRAQADDLNKELEKLSPGTPEYERAQQDLEDINTQIAVLVNQMAAIPPVADAGQVILPATVPEAPSSPKHVLNLAMGLFLGLLVGVVAAFVWDRIDERVTDRFDLEATLKAPVLASIPKVAGWNKRGPVWLVTEQQPRSPAAEAYRTLRTGIMALSRRSDVRVFAIMSPMLGEGKSTTTANLAVALAHADNRVLAISADLRRPSLHRYFRVANEIGLADVLLGGVPLEEASRALSPNLTFLSSGRPSVRPAELLQSHRMVELIDRERERFDYVLIDCSPILGLADTLAIAPFVDAVVLVATSEKTKRSAIVHTVDQLGQVGVTVRAGILNNVPLTRRSPYGYGYGDAAPMREADAGLTRMPPEVEAASASNSNGSRTARAGHPEDETLEPEETARTGPGDRSER
jgi:capsular exopolysaccharide synthesis family protein